MFQKISYYFHRYYNTLVHKKSTKLHLLKIKHLIGEIKKEIFFGTRPSAQPE